MTMKAIFINAHDRTIGPVEIENDLHAMFRLGASKKRAAHREKPSSAIDFSERWITLKRLRSAVR